MRLLRTTSGAEGAGPRVFLAGNLLAWQGWTGAVARRMCERCVDDRIALVLRADGALQHMAELDAAGIGGRDG